jgi:predicted ATP-binding protein involved in virulence
MRVKKIQLKIFKRFDDLTIDLGENPKKIIALVGPNGCGKSSIFDAFEEKLKDFRNTGNEGPSFFSKSLYYEDETKRNTVYNKHQSIILETNPALLTRKSFYIRTAYRFTSKINVNQIAAMQSILDTRDEPMSTIALDSRLESNYRRLLGASYSEFFKGTKTGDEVRKELIDEINTILKNILDIEISDLGNILENKGQFYFKKGNVKDFPYANLSSGEKEVVDIILDLKIKNKEYNETVFCIDEPELHINTAIQRKLLIEIEKLIPENCQLWFGTHSIGFLRALQEELKDKSQIIDFSEKDYFTGTHTIQPIKTSRKNWQRIFNTALEDLTGLIAPKRIIYCEGKDRPGTNGEERGFDAKVFNNIFTEKYNDTVFVSSGGNTELDQRSEIALAVLTKVFSETGILVLKDRDISSGRLNDENDRQVYLKNNPVNHRVLKRWEIENYLFDKEILIKYCTSTGLTFDETAYDAFVTDIINQNVKDEVARIRNFCGITTSLNAEIFKLNLSELITEDTNVFKELENIIFNRE